MGYCRAAGPQEQVFVRLPGWWPLKSGTPCWVTTLRWKTVRFDRQIMKPNGHFSMANKVPKDIAKQLTTGTQTLTRTLIGISQEWGNKRTNNSREFLDICPSIPSEFWGSEWCWVIITYPHGFISNRSNKSRPKCVAFAQFREMCCFIAFFLV